MALAAGSSVRGILKYFNAFSPRHQCHCKEIACDASLRLDRIAAKLDRIVALRLPYQKHYSRVTFDGYFPFSNRGRVFGGNDSTGGKSSSPLSYGTCFSVSSLSADYLSRLRLQSSCPSLCFFLAEGFHNPFELVNFLAVSAPPSLLCQLICLVHRLGQP